MQQQCHTFACIDLQMYKLLKEDLAPSNNEAMVWTVAQVVVRIVAWTLVFTSSWESITTDCSVSLNLDSSASSEAIKQDI